MLRLTLLTLTVCLALVLGFRAWGELEESAIEGRLGSFAPEALSERGQHSYRGLLQAEVVEDSFRSFTWSEPEATFRMMDLWDEPAELSTQAFLSICEKGTPAVRFYALAGLSQSDPWTFRFAYERYGHDASPLQMSLGCFSYQGEAGQLLDEHVVDGDLAEGWREEWSRTERMGPDLRRKRKP